MEICNPKGRDCIEKNSAETFDCSTNCVGIYVDVQKDVRKNFGKEMRGFLDSSEPKLNRQFDNDLQSRFVALEERMELMENVMRGGAEIDKEKYQKLIVEHQKFKTKNVKQNIATSAAFAPIENV